MAPQTPSGPDVARLEDGVLVENDDRRVPKTAAERCPVTPVQPGEGEVVGIDANAEGQSDDD